MSHAIHSAKDVDSTVLGAAEDIYQGWFTAGEFIDWDNFWDRMEDYGYDMGDSLTSPAMLKIKRHIWAVRKLDS